MAQVIKGDVVKRVVPSIDRRCSRQISQEEYETCEGMSPERCEMEVDELDYEDED